MALFKRIGTLLSADIHAVLDWVEDPQDLLKQAMREMQTELQKQQYCLSQTQQSLVHLKSQLAQLATEQEKIERNIDLCFTTQQQALLKVQIKNKLILQKQHHFLLTQQDILKKQEIQAAQNIEENEAQYEKLQQQLIAVGLTNNQHYQSGAPYTQKNTYHFSVTEDEITMALIEAKQARERS
ncbi:PspA/IM30 family protein [Aliikangiella maris]|uniref:PspA/IM30 family protein n=2 Tax=Aliikangiella maris TaxID=3162458 RepID=A0ABV2BQZ4_9GAMM